MMGQSVNPPLGAFWPLLYPYICLPAKPIALACCTESLYTEPDMLNARVSVGKRKPHTKENPTR